MKIADVEDFYVSHVGWCNLKSFREDYHMELISLTFSAEWKKHFHLVTTIGDVTAFRVAKTNIYHNFS